MPDGTRAAAVVVESAFNPVAYSQQPRIRSLAVHPEHRQHFGLQQTWWLDERRDVIKSTDAALTYLQYLQPVFQR